MPNIVSKSDFVDEISIPNDAQGFGGNSQSLTRFIAKYEPKFLAMLMGADFATLFVNGLNPPQIDPPTDPPTYEPIEQRWLDLDTPELETAIANYIYYYWMRNDESQSLGVGNAKTKNTNAELYSAKDKVSRAWHEMNCNAWKTVKFLKDNPDTYPEYVVPVWACFWQWGWEFEFFEFDATYWWFKKFYRMPDIFYPLSRL